jgi:hypothetical protein
MELALPRRIWRTVAGMAIARGLCEAVALAPELDPTEWFCSQRGFPYELHEL